MPELLLLSLSVLEEIAVEVELQVKLGEVLMVPFHQEGVLPLEAPLELSTVQLFEVIWKFYACIICRLFIPSLGQQLL